VKARSGSAAIGFVGHFAGAGVQSRYAGITFNGTEPSDKDEPRPSRARVRRWPSSPLGAPRRADEQSFTLSFDSWPESTDVSVPEH
jgi:hypothetical protein